MGGRLKGGGGGGVKSVVLMIDFYLVQLKFINFDIHILILWLLFQSFLLICMIMLYCSHPRIADKGTKYLINVDYLGTYKVQ